LRSITGADALKIQQADKQIRRWYLADVSLADEVIAEQIIEKTQPDERKQYSFSAIKGDIVNNPASQSPVTSTPSMTDSGVITLNINNQPFNISVFNKASLMVAIATLNMLAEKLHHKIWKKSKNETHSISRRLTLISISY
jgi:hypothetical protein